MLKLRLPLFIAAIILLNVLIYYVALWLEPIDRLYPECARNSGRTSAAINLILLIMVGYYGLKNIYSNTKIKQRFQLLITLFSVNHFIHLFFVSRNFETAGTAELRMVDNIHGAIIFASLILVPIIVLSVKKLNLILYVLLIAHLFNVTYFMIMTFHSRYKPGVDESYLHRIGNLIMILACIYVLYGAFKERKLRWS